MKTRTKIIGGTIGGLVVVGIIGQATGASEPTPQAPASAATSAPAAPAPSAPAPKAPAPSSEAPAPSSEAPAEPEMTSGQANALRSAENYLSIMGMSKAGLIRQLSSSAGDGYSKADATYAANHVEADWKAEAVEAAENYLSIMPMSRSGLIKQLSSSAGDQFTEGQATYAADKVL